MSFNLATEFGVLWKSEETPPDVFAFLVEHEQVNIQEKTGVLLVDQQQRWRLKIPRSVEDYLLRLPEIYLDREALLQLVVNEYELRNRDGTRPVVDEFIGRFPDIAETLRERLSSDLTVASDDIATDKTQIAEAPKELVGRYRLGRILGEGTYGRVYLGFDEALQRAVAVKVPTPARFERPQDAEIFLTEARLTASLDHPHIVAIHDVGRTSDGAIYIVSKFIEGVTLRDKVLHGRISFDETVRILIPVARALHHAHQRRLIHRDVKPGNILIESKTGFPFVADFGLAIRDADVLLGTMIAGTPSYMSPEQACGEGHRLDGRSDVFALGSILYLMLTGRKAFVGATTNEILHLIVSEDPPPPSSIESSVPSELERICLKALSKRISGRHATAEEFAQELEDWQTKPLTQQTSRAIVPHGLRSFDANDADFFLDLLPGTRSRDGIPESVQFWLRRLQETDPDATFRVGLIYGPSGCGKSSLMKAGVLPRLSGGVKTIYVEATPDETEARILTAIRKRLPAMQQEEDLVRSLQRLRQQKDGKILIIVDQFEQWLHSNNMDAQTELIRAFRHCDGGAVQAVVMIRDDFAMAAARFMDALDIPIIQGNNFATVDLFDHEHAVKVLARFGQAFGKLPQNRLEFMKAQTDFLKSVSSGLAIGGHVVPVQLALFAEMVKRKAWNLATLSEVGGTEGVGVNFLEETFSGRSANPTHKKHERAAREVLKTLLPDVGSDIKGNMQSHADLLQASGYRNNGKEFNELLRVLDGELRLITPTDPDGLHSDSGSGILQKHYQLTHDYLVPSLRDWLTRSQRATRRGRAELLLSERAEFWQSRRESRYLPSLWEYLSIRLLTQRSQWKESELAMMKTAGRSYAIRWGFAFTLLAAVGWLANMFVSTQQAATARREQRLHEQRANTLVDAVLTAPAAAVPYAIETLGPLRDYAVPILKSRLIAASTDSVKQLRIACTLAEFGHHEPGILLQSIDSAPEGEVRNIVAAFQRSETEGLEVLKRAVSTTPDSDDRRRARLGIVAMNLGDLSTVSGMLSDVSKPGRRAVLIDTLGGWYGDPVRLASVVTQADKPAVRSGLCLGIGSIPATQLEKAERILLEKLFSDWFRRQPDSATHSAADWALRKWNVDLPAIAASVAPENDRAWYINKAGITMLRIPAGSFQRAVNESEKSGATISTQVVEIGQPFDLSDCEVSRGLFGRFMEDPEWPASQKPQGWNGSGISRSPTKQHPVQAVSWNDAAMFCNWLSQQDGLSMSYKEEDGNMELIQDSEGYRLPTEAEWEYACRAGTTTLFSPGDDLQLLAGYAVFQSNQTDVCGGHLPNGWGVFDAHGNVYEWCQDWYADYPNSPSIMNPTGPSRGTVKVLRGGAFDYQPLYARSSNRARNKATYRSYTIGFRLARSAR